MDLPVMEVKVHCDIEPDPPRENCSDPPDWDPVSV